MDEVDHIFEAHRKVAIAFKERREELGMSIEDLAGKVNVPINVLNRFESFEFMPNMEMVYRLAYFLGLELAASPLGSQIEPKE